MMTLDFLLFFGALFLLTKEHLGSPIITNCDVSIVQWKVSGTCVVENMDSYYGNHVCTWRVNNIQLRGSLQGSVTRYWFDGKTYDRGVCYFTHVIPTDKGNYTVSINIDSGLWNTVKTLHIVSPGDPKYTCPDVVQEGSSVTCKCTSSNPGSPPAQFVWSGLSTDTLYVQSVKREDSGTRHTCLMTWGPEMPISRQAIITLKVAVPVSIVRSSCSVQLSKWKVQGVCTIQWLEMNNTPVCRWRYFYQSRGYGSSSVSPKSVDLGEFQGSSTFVTVDSIRYKRRNCTFEQTMPLLENDYSYSIRVSSHPDDQFSKYIRKERPGPPTHNCPAIAYEGSSIHCMCNSSKAGIPPAEFIWEEVNNEMLHLPKVQRENSGINYTCQLTWGPNRLISLENVYSFNVIVPVSIVPGSCSVELSGWKVYGVCTIRLLWTNNRMCKWTLKKKNIERSYEGTQSAFTSKSVDIYYYVNCSFMHQMPVDDGKYTYNISVSSHPADTFSRTLHIERPAPPQHNCSNVTLEGSSINCKCFSLNLGDPPAQIGWVETREEHFAIKDIKREQNGFVDTCRLTWGAINYRTPYIVTIAYGPSETYISREESSDDKTQTVLICTAIDVYPSAVFRWNISCDKETHSVNISRCTVSTTNIQDNMAVECIAHNNIFTDVSSNSTYVFKPEQNSLHGGIIAGSTAAVVIVTIIVAVIFVYIKRRKDVNKNKTQTPTAHFYAPSGQLYTIAGNVTTVDYRQHEYSTVRDTTSLDNNPRAQTPVVRFTAASGDLSTITGPAPGGNQKQLTLQEVIRNRVHASTSNNCKNKLSDLSVEGYVNVTEVPTDFRPGVYHNLPWAAIPQTVGSDARVLDQSVNTEDEYNVLRFQDDRTGEEDHAVTYSHLQPPSL
ncbi:uncharacterized protein LOC112567846 [Pomacea canaliculata]|uniref:uncharacterized protein LOC112567846 n=1 Tax=Pomacea canaliculata TaxID=400727 RepID=UPI000D72DB0F|nr:uncharacterized protein LOC112567846 [Pomacea canaliculata]